jgi:50S ribosomal protein L16 3-hydroxylase
MRRMTQQLLGGLSPARFLRDYGHRKPLLVRGALPQHAALVDRERLFALAGREDTQSRLVTRARGRWQVRHGPFSRRELERLPAAGWTLLVQGIEVALPAAHQLLEEFAFIPRARFDDLMASYAPPGGGVGPHFDSYDVFLLQGEGRRRWRVSAQRDLALVEGAPLRLLRRFRAQREWTLAPGDMLYLPPRYAHDGVAETRCVTYSIGFRAPSAQELAARFLEFLQDHLALPGQYADPGLAPARRPARIDGDMLRRFERLLSGVRWNAADVARFAGCYLTEPKPHLVFARPRRPLPARAFAAAVARRGVRLAAATLMLFHGRSVYNNGEACAPGARAAATLSRLADRRRLPPGPVAAETADWLYRWYRAGYIELDGA